MVDVTRRAFDEAMASSSEPHERVAAFGALLGRAVGPGISVVVAGGSAISIWTQGRYVSGDIDIVGRKSRIVPVLRSWGFGLEQEGARSYWVRGDFGLAVDVIDRDDYVGFSEGLLRIETPYGPVLVAAVEDLIVRRLVFWTREGKPELLDQAVMLFSESRSDLDREYLESQVRYERVERAYAAMQRLAQASQR